MRLAKTGVLIVLIALACAPALRAQTANGQVNGTVTDTSGATIAGATVKLTNTGTKITKEAATNSAGYYLFVDVLPGSYVLNIEKQGFKAASVNTFTIQVHQ